jgi:hypothetical protein
VLSPALSNLFAGKVEVATAVQQIKLAMHAIMKQGMLEAHG